MRKKTNNYITKEFVVARANYARAAGFPVPKYIQFAQWALNAGFKVFLYEARSTVSKYVYVINGNRKNKFKVRFSNHKPSAHKENIGECDFFVGVSNNKTTTTDMAMEAVMKWAQSKETT